MPRALTVLVIVLAFTGCSFVAGGSGKEPGSETHGSAAVAGGSTLSAGAEVGTAEGEPREVAVVSAPSTAPEEVRQGQRITRPRPRLGELRPLVAGMTFVPAACAAGREEQCNGIDDDCNGQIDEGCAGIRPGTLQFTMTYDTNSEIYMTVHSPVAGHRLNRNQDDVQNGGRFQAPRRQRCRFENTTDRMENAAWTSDDLPRGTYRVEVEFYSTCSRDDINRSNVQLAVALDGQYLGSYRWVETKTNLFGTERRAVLEVTIE